MAVALKTGYLILTTCALLTACEKKDDPAPVTPAVTTGTQPPVPAHVCGAIPDPPTGFTWTDSTTNVNTNIKAFFYNPANSEEMLVITEGDIQGNNRLIRVHLRTRVSTHLGNLGDYLPSINSQGQIVFSDRHGNIFLVNPNSDTLKQMTFTKSAYNPKWDHTGESFTFFQQAFGPIPSQLLKADVTGKITGGIPHNQPYSVPFNNSKKLLILRGHSGSMAIVETALDNSGEVTIFSTKYNPGTDIIPFRDLCIDQNDENIYWTNSAGIFAYNLQNSVLDTLFKSCENTIYDHPMTGSNLNEITFSKHTITVLNKVFLFHGYEAVEYNVALKQQRVLEVF